MHNANSHTKTLNQTQGYHHSNCFPPSKRVLVLWGMGYSYLRYSSTTLRFLCCMLSTHIHSLLEQRLAWLSTVAKSVGFVDAVLSIRSFISIFWFLFAIELSVGCKWLCIQGQGRWVSKLRFLPMLSWAYLTKPSANLYWTWGKLLLRWDVWFRFALRVVCFCLTSISAGMKPSSSSEYYRIVYRWKTIIRL